MVDAVILRVVLKNINSLLQKEFRLVGGVDREMERLSSVLVTIQDVLQDAGVKQFNEEAIKTWLTKLKDAAYVAEDILDECAAKALQLEEQGRNHSNPTCNQVTHSSFLSWFNFEQLIFRRKIGHRIKAITKRFDDIAAERFKFHLNPWGIVEQSTVEIISSERETSSILTESQVYGRDEDKEKIIEVLLNNNISHPNLLVYPILGMGGLGKTTLAQLVYNDERVKNHFEARNWVCVSDDFDVKRLTRAIIESMGGTAGDLTSLDPMQSRLREMLGRRRFLLVLDDVWNEDQDKWNMLKYSLTGGTEGSSILVTTRTGKVASIMGTSPAHDLKGLSEDDCWALFKQCAFGVGREEEHAKLVEIGKEIVKKCGGVPLAAKALGSLMRFKHTETEWQFVRDSEIWDLPEEEENTILRALRLSYNHLPSHLRQCFAYCSIFPKDYRMEKEQLVHIWMANGFIPSKGNMELEDIGSAIFNELLWRSFFQEAEEDGSGNVVTCKMHDLVHDLACSVMGKECLTLESGKEKVDPKGIRHVLLLLDLNQISSSLSDVQTSLASINESSRKFQNIRTLLLNSLSAESCIVIPHLNFSNFGCLRALELKFGSYISGASISVAYLKHLGYFIHLRYLKLSLTSIRTLPESLSNLKHLQTLILSSCWRLETLPAHMSNMSSLRHLNIDCYDTLSHMPSGIGRLIHLQTLSIFIVGKKSGCRISELQGLNNLRGKLHIKGLEKVKDSMEAKEANLIGKGNLDSLSLSWSWSSSPNIENAEEVLEGLQPPGSIRRMEIERYEGMKFPSWMVDCLTSLRNLVSVKLSDCKRCEHLPPLGHLPLLKVLEVRGMDTVRYLDDESYGGGDHGLGKLFPSLEKLYLEDMLNLEELLLLLNNNINVPADDDEDDHQGIRRQVVFPCLVEMRIRNCDKLTTLAPLELPSLEHLYFGTEKENIPEGFLQIWNLPVLQRLEINHCPNLVTLPRLSTKSGGELEFISSLKVLEISRCDALKSLWEDETQLQGLSSLKELRIHFCGKLASLSGMRYLTALEHLSLCYCEELQLSQVEDFRYLTSLQRLQCWWLPQLISLPESLKQATMLQSLFMYCSGLTALPEWIHNLTSLRNIEILHCGNFTFLPDGLSQLTALKTLKIEDCHVDLETRCKEGGEDWHKISHIPNVKVRSSEPQTSQPPTRMRQIHRCWSRLFGGGGDIMMNNKDAYQRLHPSYIIVRSVRSL